jgi:hypothetical protein
VPTPSQTTPAPEPYAGPIVFVGDELASLLPSSDEIIELIPAATQVSGPSDMLEQISDGGGPEFSPAICGAFYMEQSLGALGTRTVSWSMPGDGVYPLNDVMAMQFADEATVTARMDEIEQAATECGEFDYGGPNSFDAVVADDDDGVRALAGTLQADASWGSYTGFHGYAAVGNTLVHLRTALQEGAAVDAAAAAELLQKTAVEAKSALAQSLTADPPAAPSEPEGDASVPWSDWTITELGVGPIRFGDTYEDVSAALPEAEVSEPAYEGGPWVFTSADGASSLSVDAADDGTISGITAGAVSDEEASGVDGAAAPNALGVRIGDPVSAALAAFPGGTRVHVSSSGQWAYFASDRDGHRIAFHTAREDADSAEARIIGITTADATRWGQLRVD